MSILIYSSVVLSLFYFLLRNRVDFLLVFLFSTLLYHWQIIYGTIIIPPYIFDVNSDSKIIVTIVLLTHLIITYIHDKINMNNSILINFDDWKKYDSIAYALCFISLFLTLRALYTVGFDFTYKQEYKNALAANNINMVFTYYSSAMSLLFGVLTKNKNLIFLSLLPLVNYVYMGYRALFVVAIIGSIIIYFYNTKLFSKKVLKLSLILTLVFIFFSIHKVAYFEIKKNENFSFINQADKIVSADYRYDSRLEYLASIFFYSEFGQTSSNLTLATENELGEKYDFITMVLGSIPFVKRFTNITEEDVRFSRLIRRYANPGFSYGLASNVWAEAYAALNFLGVFLFSILISSIIAFLNSVFFRLNIFYLFNILFLSFLSFYIHRNDMTLIFAHLKNSVFLIFVAVLIVGFYQLFLKILLSNFKKNKIK